MDAVGIDAQVLVAERAERVLPRRGTGARADTRVANEHFAEVVATAGGRFRAFASVPINHPEVALEELEHALGLEGVLLGTIVDGRRLDSPELRPPFKEVDRRRTPILLHPGTPWGVEQMGDLRLAPLTGKNECALHQEWNP